MSEETKENLIENAFIAAPEWGPFVVEDAQINDIVVDNGGNSEMGESPSAGQTLVVQGIKMYLNQIPPTKNFCIQGYYDSGSASFYENVVIREGVPQPLPPVINPDPTKYYFDKIENRYYKYNSGDSEYYAIAEPIELAAQDVSEHTYTSWELNNTIITGGTNAAYLVLKAPFIKMEEVIYDLNATYLCYGTKYWLKDEEDDEWKIPSEYFPDASNFSSWFGKDYVYDLLTNNTGADVKWHFSGNTDNRYENYYVAPSIDRSNKQPRYYGVYFVIESISGDTTCTSRGETINTPYGFATVQPYFIGLFENIELTFATKYTKTTGNTGTVSGATGLKWYMNAHSQSSGSQGFSEMKMYIPFRNEQERNYAFGITKTFTRLTREDYETRASAAASEAAGHPVEIHLPTVDDINEKYENENGGE